MKSAQLTKVGSRQVSVHLYFCGNIFFFLLGYQSQQSRTDRGILNQDAFTLGWRLLCARRRPWTAAAALCHKQLHIPVFDWNWLSKNPFEQYLNLMLKGHCLRNRRKW